MPIRALRRSLSLLPFLIGVGCFYQGIMAFCASDFSAGTGWIIGMVGWTLFSDCNDKFSKLLDHNEVTWWASIALPSRAAERKETK